MILALLLHFKVWVLLLFICQKVFADKQVLRTNWLCPLILAVMCFFLPNGLALKLSICAMFISVPQSQQDNVPINYIRGGKSLWEKRFNTSAKQEQEPNCYLYFCSQRKQLVFHWKVFIPCSLLFQLVSLTIPLLCETMADTSNCSSPSCLCRDLVHSWAIQYLCASEYIG